MPIILREADDKLQTFLEDSIGRLVTGHRFFSQMLVALSECLQFSEPGIESHSWMIRILCEIQICCSSQLLLNNKSLLQQL